MKINHKTLSLIIASLCGACASGNVYGQTSIKPIPAASTGRIGDGSTAASAPVPATPRPMSAQTYPTSAPYQSESYQSSDYQEGYSDYSGMGYGSEEYGYSSPNHYENSYGSTNVAYRNSSAAWVELESLLWWGKGLSGTPSILGADPGASLPTNVLSGGESSPLGKGLMPGMRATVGAWLDSDQNYAVSGRVYGLFGGDDKNTFGSGNGNNGIQYFDTVFGQSLFPVNVAVDGVGANTGSVREVNDTDFLGADLSLRTLMIGDTSSRVDLLTGYTFMRLDSGYSLGTTLVNGLPDFIPDGTVTTTLDNFTTKNEFHGGHVGFASDVTSGRFTLSMLGKIALGNLKQTSSVSGQYTELQPGSTLYTESRGLFTQPSNIGTVNHERFTFLPEVGAKLKYQLGRGQIGVGYSLLVMPSVVMAADQIDHTIDFANITSTMLAPLPKFNTDTYFLHGLDLGYTFRF